HPRVDEAGLRPGEIDRVPRFLGGGTGTPEEQEDRRKGSRQGTESVPKHGEDPFQVGDPDRSPVELVLETLTGSLEASPCGRRPQPPQFQQMSRGGWGRAGAAGEPPAGSAAGQPSPIPGDSFFPSEHAHCMDGRRSSGPRSLSTKEAGLSSSTAV